MSTRKETSKVTFGFVSDVLGGVTLAQLRAVLSDDLSGIPEEARVHIEGLWDQEEVKQVGSKICFRWEHATPADTPAAAPTPEPAPPPVAAPPLAP